MFSYSNLMKVLNTNSCNLPPAEPLEMDTVDTPYYVIADAAFAQCMKLTEIPCLHAGQQTLVT